MGAAAWYTGVNCMRSGFLFLLLLCVFTLYSFSPAHAQTTNVQERAALQAQLDQIESDIANNQGTLTDLQKQRTTLERDISILDNKIKTAQLQIKQTDLTLKKIGGDISGKQAAIKQVDSKMVAGQKSLAQILRQTRQIDDIPMATLLLSSGSISDIFQEIDNFETLQKALSDSFTQMEVLRSDLAARKQALEEKHVEAQQVRTAQVIAKQAVQNDEKEKQTILTQTKGQEKTYQQIIADKQKQAAAIRAALFGLRDSAAIPFGTAYQYAKEASVKTGVRAALTLAVLRQETNLGENVGQCLLTNSPNKGDGKGKNTNRIIAKVMKPDRDVDPFLAITDELGINPYSQVVSCPQSVGYGGAMGPAQFIPSTWMLYKNRLANITGQNPPDPWSARTAIFATALLMADNGADGGTPAAERKAALKYFAGSNWSKPANAIYGTRVMEYAETYQADINILDGR